MRAPDPDSIIPWERLPERFARSLEDPPVEPVRARPAATIVLMRDGHSGMEVLLMRRSRSAGFVPGAYVFPGGRVDASDADAEILARVDGLTPADAEARLELGPDASPPAIAYYLAALREAFEETGILVAHGPEGDAPPTASESDEVDLIRNELMDDAIGFAAALDRTGCRIEGASVEYLAHWITPVVEPRRYDTRFFAAKVRPGSMPVIDPREMTDAVWVTPAEALARHESGLLPMVFPTIKTLEELAGARDVDGVLAGLRGRRIPTLLPRLVATATGVGTVLEEVT